MILGPLIRGACLVAVGFGLGYVKAMSDVPEAKELLDYLKKGWAETGAKNDDEVVEGEIVQ